MDSEFSWNYKAPTLDNLHFYADPNELTDLLEVVINGSEEDNRFLSKNEQWQVYLYGIENWADHYPELYDSNSDEFAAQNNIYVAQQKSILKSKSLSWSGSYHFEQGDQFYFDAIFGRVISDPGFNDNFLRGVGSKYDEEKVNFVTLKTAWHEPAWHVDSEFFIYDYHDKMDIVSVPHSAVFGFDISGINPEENETPSYAGDFRVNIARAQTKGFAINFEKEWSSGISVSGSMLGLNSRYKKGRVTDPRIAAFSPYTNADALRFNTAASGVMVPDSAQGEYIHFIDAYTFVNPTFQVRREGVDLDQDGELSSFAYAECNEGDLNIAGDGSCTSVFRDPPDNEQPERDLAGNHLPRTPTWDMSFGIGYEFGTRLGFWSIHTGLKYRSRYYLTPFNGDGYEPYVFDIDGRRVRDIAPSLFDRVESHTTFNASVAWESRAEQPWSLQFSVSNLTNEQYFTEVHNTAWSYAVGINTPRQWRLSLAKELTF